MLRLQGKELSQGSVGTVFARGDRKWLKKQRERIAEKTSGERPRIVSAGIWHLARLLMHPQLGLEALKRFAAKVPSTWLSALFAVAMVRYDGTYRSADSRRARSILTLGILLWFLARPVKHGGQWGYVVRGLPAGVFLALLGWYEHWGSRRRQPAKTTVYGTHRPGGRFDRAEVGYLAALRQAGLIRTVQLPWEIVKPEHRGPVRTNAKGEIECWAFSEIFLRIPTPGLTPLQLGPPPAERTYLPPPREAMEPELDRRGEPTPATTAIMLPPAPSMAPEPPTPLPSAEAPSEALVRELLERRAAPPAQPSPASRAPFGWRGKLPSGQDLVEALLDRPVVKAALADGGSDPPPSTA